MSVLGEYLADPQHGPAGTKQRETAWCTQLSGVVSCLSSFSGGKPTRGGAELEAAGEQPLCVWESRVLEKPASEHWEGLAPVR